MELTDGLKAQLSDETNQLFRFDLLTHEEELNAADVIERIKLFFAWGNYFHWCEGSGVRGQASQINGWLEDRLWGNESDDWFEIKAFILDTAEYLNDEDNFFDLTGTHISTTTAFRRNILMKTYERFGEYLRRALAELDPSDAYVIEVVNAYSQFWVEWYAANVKDIVGYELGRVNNVYDAIQGNLRETPFGNTDAALDESYALKA